MYEGAKRIADVAIAVVALALLAPVLVVVVGVLRVTGEGDVVFSQERVGKGGRRFRLMKLATMLRASPSMGTGTITLKDDPRVLPVGRWLRKWKLNEIPQLVNVLRGEMSLVGPRPQTEECFEYFPKKDWDVLWSVKPGVTGVGSIVFRNEEELLKGEGRRFEQAYRDQIMPYKAALEVWYVEHRSLWVDFVILVMTGLVVIAPGCRLHERLLRGLPAAPEGVA